MKPAPFVYHAPESVDEALATLAELGSDGKVLAGGQSLVPLLNMRLAAPAALVDIERLEQLDTIDVSDAAVRIGARVRHARLHRDAEVARAIPLLRQALDWVAHPVIRNRGTSLGSIVHADPAAELPAVLALLGGSVELASTIGTRTVPAADFLLGPLESDLRVGELAVAATFPRPTAGTGSAFVELSRRHGDYALAGVGVTVTLDGDRHLTAARATFIGVTDTPAVVDLSGALAGQPADAMDLDAARQVADPSLTPDADIHATAEYRRHLAGVLLGRALTAAAGHATDREGAA
ncbi:MAG: xanthine dehydrogenase family protein subunit M [Nitriliruptor sp.]